MDVDGYRFREKRIILPQDGTTPEIPEKVGQEEQRILLSWISCVWRAVDIVSLVNQRQINAHSVPTSIETFLGWKRWFSSHHLFIPFLAMSGHSLARGAAEIQNGHRAQAKEWTELAARLRRGCGALFLYSIDFQPCSTIYCEHIRSHMPDGFSGYEIRERQNSFQPGVEAFNTAFSKSSTDTWVKETRSIWIAADLRYHELHERCMVEAVPAPAPPGSPKGESLRAAYRRKHGYVPTIDEAAYQEYDSWFAIERRNDVTRLDYVFQVCDVVERLLADLIVGHRLESAVIDELLDSMRAALTLFGRWAGPVHESSPFYPRYLRGE